MPELLSTPTKSDEEAVSTDRLNRWFDQLAFEVMLSEAGSSRSQLPIRDLLSLLQETTANLQERAALGEALEYVDRAIFASRLWDEQDLVLLNTMLGQLRDLRENPALTAHRVLQRNEPPVQVAPLETSPAEVTPSVAEMESVMPDLGKDAEFLREFANEAREHLAAIEQSVLTLEQFPTDRPSLDAIFRAFHTIKGNAGFLRLTNINRLAHELESLLDLARCGEFAITSAAITLILGAADHMKAFVAELEAQLDGMRPTQPIEIAVAAFVIRKQALIRDPGASPLSAPTSPESCPPALAPEAIAKANTIKVDIKRLDSLLDFVGELVVTQSQLLQHEELSQTRNQHLLHSLNQLTRTTKELQKLVMKLRMIPLRPTFQRMNRLVRDLSLRLNKEVELQLHGEDTELDRTLIEELADPLMHMIRNAVDHGIESPEERTARGKSRSGTIHLSAYHQNGNVIIEIRDNGHGLDAGRLSAKATARGIIPPDTVLSESEAFDLIFAAGFSTAEVVTETSGRGVGMDVVRRNIEKLHGHVEIASELGHGTTFKIHLPLTLAIVDGLLARVGGQRFIIPTVGVRESVRPSPENLSRTEQGDEIVTVRGSAHPVLRLGDHFNIETGASSLAESIAVIIESAGKTCGLFVDELLGKQEFVIKTLGEPFKRNRSLAGAAILADGHVGLILEPRSLVLAATGLG